MYYKAILAGVLIQLLTIPVLSRGQTPPATENQAQSDSLSTIQVEHIRTFAKLYGYVRYFHPSDAASAIDWDKFAIYGVRQVQNARDQKELRTTLETLFSPIAPTVLIYPAGEQPPAPPDILIPADTTGLNLVVWQHRGLGHDNSRFGYRSVRLNRKSTVTEGPGFGTIIQSIDASPYRGKQIRLSAAVKTEVDGEKNGAAQLWLRVDRPNQQRGFFDNMRDRPITSPEWNTYHITGSVANDAEQIVFGGFLRGEGKAWIDEFQLSVRDPGQEMWRPIGIGNAGFEEGETGKPPKGWKADTQGYEFATEDIGYSGNRSVAIVSLAEERMSRPLFEESPDAGEVINRPLGRGLSVQLPLALYSRNGQTFRPENAPSSSTLEAQLQDIALDELTAADGSFRYADIVIAWNVLQHFYPYFDVVNTDWEQVLTQSLQRASDDHSTEDFYYTLWWMVAQLDDGHGHVHHPVEKQHASLPFLVDRIEGEVIIVAVADHKKKDACYQRGDIIVSLNGTSSEEIFKESFEYLSGTERWKMSCVQRQFGRGKRGETVRITLQ